MIFGEKDYVLYPSGCEENSLLKNHAFIDIDKNSDKKTSST